jgi:hypothetical protein
MAKINYERFNLEDIYIDDTLEEVMFRSDYKSGDIYLKFYGKSEHPEPVLFSNRLYADALLNGEEITREAYLKGKEKRI